MPKRAFSPQEVAHLLGISTMTVYREIKRGRLSCGRAGRRIVITRPDLETWIGSARAQAVLGDDEATSAPTGEREVL